MNRELLARLAARTPLIEKYSDARLPSGATKVGDGLNNVVIGKDFVASNLPHPKNPGFTFAPGGSTIRQGTHLDLEGAYTTLFFRQGEQQLNPLGHAKASSTTDPLPTIVPSLRRELAPYLTPDWQKILATLRAL